jgi:hypothetical protein
MSPEFSSHCPFRRRRKEARPAELLDAALKLFVEKGFAATRSEEVARAVIQHFLADQIAAGAQEAAAHEGPTPQIMEELLATWWSRMYESPASGVFKLVITEVRNFPEIARFYVEHVIEPGNALVAGLLARGIERGEFRPVNIESAAHSLLMPLVMLCVHKHSLGACGLADACGPGLQSDPLGFVRDHLHIVLQGLEVRASEPPARQKPRNSPETAEGGTVRAA